MDRLLELTWIFWQNQHTETEQNPRRGCRMNNQSHFGQSVPKKSVTSRIIFQSVCGALRGITNKQEICIPLEVRPWLCLQSHPVTVKYVSVSAANWMSLNDANFTSDIIKNRYCNTEGRSRDAVEKWRYALISRRWPMEKTGFNIFLCLRCCSPAIGG